MAETAEQLSIGQDEPRSTGVEMALCRERYCIVGAGPAGLAVARRLREAGIAFDILERHRDVGGIWDLENPGTAMYESAHFISSKTLSGFSDFAFPPETPDYPSRAQVLSLIRAYADHHGLRPFVQHGMEVTGMDKHPGGWLVQLRDASPRIYRGVVLANGHQWVPNWPSYPGVERYAGKLLHSIDYRSAGLFEGKRVLIVGCGASAVDIANDAASRAEKTVLSARRGHHFVPKHLFGQPTDVWAAGGRGPQLPTFLRQFLLKRLLRLLHGDLARYGLPRPDHEILERPPILNSMIFEHLSHGRLTVKPDVRRVHEHGAEFVDGSEGRFDVIVFCTGYRECWPFLPAKYLRPTGAGDLILQVLHRRYDDLFVAGLLRSNAGGFAVFERQGELMALAMLASPERRRRLAALEDGPSQPRGTGIKYQKNDYQSQYFDAPAYDRALAECAAFLRQ